MDENDCVALALACMKNMGIDTECGACMEIAFTGITQAKHTCKEKQDGIIQ